MPLPRVINFGSLNLDFTYKVDAFARPGETVLARSVQQFYGGKGLNQSLALARAGATVFHAGKIGPEGGPLVELLKANGVDTTFVGSCDTPNGHAVIQVNSAGENSIIVFKGANFTFTASDAETALFHFAADDILLLQNGIGSVTQIINLGSERGLKIFYNPAPVKRTQLDFDPRLISCLFVNEIEAREISGCTEEKQILQALVEKFPNAKILLTLGERGAWACDAKSCIYAPGYSITTLDSTGAGDAFIGYYVAEIAAGALPERALERANAAGAITASRSGVADSIPTSRDVTDFLKTGKVE
jgi:ribokinase